MRILFDLSYVNPSSSSGIVIYAYRLLNGFEELNATSQIMLLVTEVNKLHIQKKFPKFKTVVIDFKKSKLRDKLYFLNGLLCVKKVNRIIGLNSITLFFSPSLSIGGLFTSKVTHVGVLHDAQTFILQRKNGFKGWFSRILMLKLYNNVTEIVTISHYAKFSILREIVKLSTPVSVIYNSVVKSKATIGIHFNFNAPYILFVNTLMPYKNLETLVTAFGILKDKINHNLIVKANYLPYWDDVIKPIISKYNITDRVFLVEENYSEKKMASLYRDADLFVSPSLMEGFGYTPIEAAMQNTAVITSKETALFETTMGLLNYYEPPCDFVALSNKIYDILLNRPSEKQLINISETLEKKYSALNQAKSFNKFFNQITKNNLR